jgi:hypothetical protein
MIEKPFVAVGALAQKIQAVSTKVALSAAKTAEKMAAKVARIQAKAAAKAAAKAHARALKALPKRPSVHFLRELRHGQTSISFYRSIDHRAGKVTEFWTLNRDTPRGRVRLASGPMSEFHSLRNITNQSVRPAVQPRPGPPQAPVQTRPGPQRAPEQPGQRQRAHQPPERRQTKARKPERDNRPDRRRQNRSEPTM